MIEGISQAIETFAAEILFGVIVLTFYGLALLALLFAGVAVRAAWRWLAGHSWRDVIVSVERRALSPLLRGAEGKR